MIPELQKRRVTFSKRRPTLFKKAGELAIFTNSDLFLGVRSPTGRTFYSSYKRGKLINSNNARRKGNVNSSTGPKQWDEGLVKQECDACMAKEDLQSVISNYEACLAYARERLRNWDNNPLVKAGESGVKVDSETEEMTDEGIDSILKSFHTSMVNSAAGASDPTSSGLDDRVFSTDELFELAESRIRNDDRAENSAVGGEGFNPDDYAELENLDVDLDLRGF